MLPDGMSDAAYWNGKWSKLHNPQLMCLKLCRKKTKGNKKRHKSTSSSYRVRKWWSEGKKGEIINILRDFIFKKYYKTSQISTKSASFYNTTILHTGCLNFCAHFSHFWFLHVLHFPSTVSLQAILTHPSYLNKPSPTVLLHRSLPLQFVNKLERSF